MRDLADRIDGRGIRSSDAGLLQSSTEVNIYLAIIVKKLVEVESTDSWYTELQIMIYLYI